MIRGEWAEAEAMLERALRAGGPFEPAIRGDLARVRERLAARSGSGDSGASDQGASHRTQQP
jgi:hypothetical protein